MGVQEKIDDYINRTADWRGTLIAEIRALIHEIEPEITEEWKWNSPIFSYKGKMACSLGAFKTHVGLNFFNGAELNDPEGLFNSGLDAKKSRAINFKKENDIDKNALKELLTRAIHQNA